MITAPHLHAMVIHFPIALLIAGFFSELISATEDKDVTGMILKSQEDI